MSPAARRIAIPILVAGIALAVVVVGIVTKSGTTAPSTVGATPKVAESSASTETGPQTNPPPDAGTGEDDDASSEDGASADGAALDDSAGPSAGNPPNGTTSPGADFGTLTAVAPDRGISGHAEPTQSLGSLDPDVAVAKIEWSRAGAGIERFTFSNIWETAEARHQADAFHKAVAAGEQPTTALPADDLRYVLKEAQLLSNQYRGAGFVVPMMAALSIEINGQRVNLFDSNAGPDGQPVFIWAETGPGQFETVVVDSAGEPVLEIKRRFVLGKDYDITVEQRFLNQTGAPLRIRWIQYGPGGLRLDRARYMDRRRYRFGYLELAGAVPTAIVYTDDNDLLVERTDILKRWEKAEEARFAGDMLEQQEQLSLWPNKTSRKKQYELSWFGATNRYFAVTVHPLPDASGTVSFSLAPIVQDILIEVSDAAPGATGLAREQQTIFTYLKSPVHTIEPWAEFALDHGVYAGPLDRHTLDDESRPYRAFAMNNLILYQMSSWCAICTFQWLAHGLIAFLTLLKTYVVFDWGLAIIGLVLVVRTLLHPITKRSQISMQRFGKQMSAMKPELDKLQKKHGHDPKKMQQEQMRLMREHGANPLQMLGCLPMFLQTPIWIALYAMLYFAFDLRQEPAFFGLFQTLTGGAWPFLADLSSADHFFGQLDEPRQFLLWNVTGFNFLPLLMGVIFYIQQKYMSPPPSPTMTDDQLRQQKIMKIMMVVMFPLMLYSAPSGLTLYILTSSCIGIIESRYVRRHITEMDLNPEKLEKKPTKGKPKDAQGRAFAAAMDRMEEKKRAKQRGPAKKYKKRK